MDEVKTITVELDEDTLEEACRELALGVERKLAILWDTLDDPRRWSEEFDLWELYEEQAWRMAFAWARLAEAYFGDDFRERYAGYVERGESARHEARPGTPAMNTWVPYIFEGEVVPAGTSAP